jgi:hypothetical protein
MPDATAWILLGPESAAFGTDLFDPSHLLTLRDNDRSSWTLTPIAQNDPVRTWIPFSPATLVHDAVLMAAVHVFHDEQLLESASRLIPAIDAQRLDLNALGTATESEAHGLYEQCRSLTWKCSMVVTVLSHSSVRNVVGDLEQYPFSTRLCLET